MIDLTDGAIELIQRLVGVDRPATAGLRLSPSYVHGSLEMSIADEPAEGDIIIERDGVSLFLAPSVGARLSGQKLDAQLDQRPAFFLVPS